MRLILIFKDGSYLLLHVVEAHRLSGQMKMWIQLLIQLNFLKHDILKEQVGFLIIDFGIEYSQHLGKIIPGQVELRAHAHR